MTDAPSDRRADGDAADAPAAPPSAGAEAPVPVPPAVAEALRRVAAFERQHRRLASEHDVDAIAAEAGALADAVRAGLAARRRAAAETPAGRRVWLAVGLVLLAVILWHEATRPPPPPPHLTLPEPVVVFTVAQDSAFALPGSDETVLVLVNDVETGFATLSVRGPGLEPLVPTRRVRDGDAVPFAVGGVDYVLDVLALQGNLVGGDAGAFAVRRPETPRPEPPSAADDPEPEAVP